MANLSELLEKIVAKINASVKTEAQTLIDAEKAQARENIGAGLPIMYVDLRGEIANYTSEEIHKHSLVGGHVVGLSGDNILLQCLFSDKNEVCFCYQEKLRDESISTFFIVDGSGNITTEINTFPRVSSVNGQSGAVTIEPEVVTVNIDIMTMTASMNFGAIKAAADAGKQVIASMVLPIEGGITQKLPLIGISDVAAFSFALSGEDYAVIVDADGAVIFDTTVCIKRPMDGKIGQALVVKAVSEDGIPTEWECADSNVRINLLDYGVDLYALFVAGGGSCAITNHADLYNKIQTKENVMLVCTSALEPFNGYQLEIAAVKSAWGNVFTQLTANGVIRHSSVDYELSLIIKDVDSDSAKAVLVVEQLGASSGAAEKEIFVAEYGVTPYAEIMAAHEAGKACFVKHVESDGNVRIFTVMDIKADRISAFGFYGDTAGRRLTVSKTNNWSSIMSTFQITANLTKEINANSTDTKYPSAKAVYDHVAEKTTKTISLDDYDGGDAGSSLSYIIFSMLQEGTEKFSGVMSEEFFAACNVDSPIRLTTGIAGPIVHIDNVTRGYYNSECVQVSFPIRIEYGPTLYNADVIISGGEIIVKQQPTNSAVPPVVELSTVVTNGAVLTEEESAALTAAYESGLPCMISCNVNIDTEMFSYVFSAHKGKDNYAFVWHFMQYMAIIMQGNDGSWQCGIVDYMSNSLPTYTNVSEVGA